MGLKDISDATLQALANAARAGQNLMREAFGLDVRPTGHWGSYTQSKFAALPVAQQEAVKKVVSAYGADIGAITKIAQETSANEKSSKLAQLPSSNSKQVFKDSVIPSVMRLAKDMGFLNPSLAVAQLAHESAVGAKVSGKFNYGGIKATLAEPGTMLATTEYNSAGTAIATTAKFKNYPNPDAFVMDYLRALIRKWPRTMTARTGEQWAAALVENPRMKYFTQAPALYASAINRLQGQLALA